MDMNKVSVPGEDISIRCPKLGHEITFSYCRSESGDLPCRKVLDCWYPYFEVEVYFRTRLTEEEWREIFESPPKPKMLTLLELIDLAKKRQRDMNNR